MSMNDISFILKCTLENALLLVPLTLVSGGIAFFAGRTMAGRTEKSILRLFPLIAAELVLFFAMFPYLVRWAGMGSFTWGFWYEGGWSFYLPFSVMVGFLVGYLLGIALKKRA